MGLAIDLDRALLQQFRVSLSFISLYFFYFSSGLSLKSQELTAYFLAARLYCSFVIEYDVHTFLDLATLVATLWVIYMIRYKLKASYMGDKDNFKVLYLVSLLLLLGFFIKFIRILLYICTEFN